MSTRDRDHYGTVLSYAVPGQDNELVFTDYGGFVLAVAGRKVVTDVVADVDGGAWGQFCAEWESKTGRWAIYKDGVKADGGDGLAQGVTIKGGGSIIVGQEQDEVGGKFSTLESFRGKITRLNMWNTTLDGIFDSDLPPNATAEEVASYLLSSCADVSGNLVSWGDARSGASGGVRVVDTVQCPQCPDLDAPAHGNMIKVDGDKVVFSCQEGYMFMGGEEEDGVRRCGVLGEWDKEAPQCQGFHYLLFTHYNTNSNTPHTRF